MTQPIERYDDQQRALANLRAPHDAPPRMTPLWAEELADFHTISYAERVWAQATLSKVRLRRSMGFGRL